MTRNDEFGAKIRRFFMIFFSLRGNNKKATSRVVVAMVYFEIALPVSRVW